MLKIFVFVGMPDTKMQNYIQSKSPLKFMLKLVPSRQLYA